MPPKKCRQRPVNGSCVFPTDQSYILNRKLGAPYAQKCCRRSSTSQPSQAFIGYQPLFDQKQAFDLPPVYQEEPFAFGQQLAKPVSAGQLAKSEQARRNYINSLQKQVPLVAQPFEGQLPPAYRPFEGQLPPAFVAQGQVPSIVSGKKTKQVAFREGQSTVIYEKEPKLTAEQKIARSRREVQQEMLKEQKDFKADENKYKKVLATQRKKEQAAEQKRLKQLERDEAAQKKQDSLNLQKFNRELKKQQKELDAAEQTARKQLQNSEQQRRDLFQTEYQQRIKAAQKQVTRLRADAKDQPISALVVVNPTGASQLARQKGVEDIADLIHEYSSRDQNDCENATDKGKRCSSATQFRNGNGRLMNCKPYCAENCAAWALDFFNQHPDRIVLKMKNGKERVLPVYQITYDVAYDADDVIEMRSAAKSSASDPKRFMYDYNAGAEEVEFLESNDAREFAAKFCEALQESSHYRVRIYFYETASQFQKFYTNAMQPYVKERQKIEKDFEDQEAAKEMELEKLSLKTREANEIVTAQLYVGDEKRTVFVGPIDFREQAWVNGGRYIEFATENYPY